MTTATLKNTSASQRRPTLEAFERALDREALACNNGPTCFGSSSTTASSGRTTRCGRSWRRSWGARPRRGLSPG